MSEIIFEVHGGSNTLSNIKTKQLNKRRSKVTFLNMFLYFLLSLYGAGRYQLLHYQLFKASHLKLITNLIPFDKAIYFHVLLSMILYY